MGTIRYTLSGDYDSEASFEARSIVGPVDFSDLDYFQVKTGMVTRFDVYGQEVMFSLYTDDPVGERVNINPGQDGIFVDFSDRSSGLHLQGGSRGDVLVAGSGNDLLEGGAGNDVIEGGLGTNEIRGGTGTNTISYEHLVLPGGGGLYVHLGLDFANDYDMGAYLSDTLSNVQNVIGSAFDDELFGSVGDNVFEGGAGADSIYGGGGIDTASYSRSSAGVLIDLTTGVTGGGDAQGDQLFDISNLRGSAHADTLVGNASANTLTGNGGGDALYGLDGNDRLVITDTPAVVDGGAGADLLFVTGGGAVSLSDNNFAEIEAVYVRNGTTLDMSGVSAGARIVSQSISGQGSGITGTSAADRILAGKGGDTIAGGTGADKIFAGDGNDTFRFEAGFGRDNLYGLDLEHDRIAVDIAGVDAGDVVLRSLNAGKDTVVTFAGLEATNKIILHDVAEADVRAELAELFIFGA